ncbi:uncharacterized protein PITG_19959 [Phytophthora infestans T30-4]|uniref:Uncharacterized protein n=1 Tax=Phytophthora infestans (strain T30-4) TaxID=403677 RepID=D0P1L8_PHYIT|nr:uncharacterized protein PITG_19959 [Phytophthora infestans T30-4]EEY54650.1 hypothetical protein PITG_19959 [Phytophthora infestans T30-4]|eukprot:XP_002895791.1 hypothetical protein PITG_19959 [Phytophthora infestans T30-4]
MVDAPRADRTSRPRLLLHRSCRRADHNAVPSSGLKVTRRTRLTPPKHRPEVITARCSAQAAEKLRTEQKRARSLKTQQGDGGDGGDGNCGDDGGDGSGGDDGGDDTGPVQTAGSWSIMQPTRKSALES